RQEGWDVDILAHHRRGGAVLGICGGYQMLGKRLSDPDGIEGEPGDAAGLGLLAIETTLAGAKTLAEAAGTDIANGEAVRGYHMHVGVSGVDAAPMLKLDSGPDGAVSADGRVRGCYLHGLFATDSFRHAFLDSLKRREASGVAYEAAVDETLDALAAHMEEHLAVDRLLEVARAA
ncbi:MAG: cobyric acid synthase CobQ, partial [Alphaproteobacteria bacterium]|nr:cobyric acid synthase CobQ [Alphaproteobacteria bacterium]